MKVVRTSTDKYSIHCDETELLIINSAMTHERNNLQKDINQPDVTVVASTYFENLQNLHSWIAITHDFSAQAHWLLENDTRMETT